jgi:hypothetical protein
MACARHSSRVAPVAPHKLLANTQLCRCLLGEAFELPVLTPSRLAETPISYADEH